MLGRPNTGGEHPDTDGGERCRLLFGPSSSVRGERRVAVALSISNSQKPVGISRPLPVLATTRRPLNAVVYLVLAHPGRR